MTTEMTSTHLQAGTTIIYSTAYGTHSGRHRGEIKRCMTSNLAGWFPAEGYRHYEVEIWPGDGNSYIAIVLPHMIEQVLDTVCA